MELRCYWRILRRRIGLVVLLLAATGLSYVIARPAAPVTYTTSMRYVVGITPEQTDGDYYTYDRYYAWLTAEYLIDDLSEVVKSQSFAQDVAAVAGVDVPAGTIQGMTAAGKLHRILTVSVSGNDAGQVQAIADGITDVLASQATKYFAQLDTPQAKMTLIDPPVVSPVGASLRSRLDLPLRLILALAVGIGLAFLLEYLDVTMRDRSDVAALGIPLLAEIPASRWATWLPLPRRRQP